MDHGVEQDRPQRHPTEAGPSHRETSPEVACRPELVALAAKARLLARLLGGDEGMLANELAVGLEALVGPLAEVVPLAASRRSK